MLNTRPLFCLSWFRHRFIVWLFLPIFCCSFFPQISNAQQIQTPVTEINITDIQSLLQQLGYDPGPIDGIMGKKTAAAITAFQTAINVSVDGQATTELLALLQRELVKTTGPTATLTALNGTALVKGQTAENGIVLIAEDVLETQVETTAELTFSDQSQVELDGATRLGIRELSQTETGARITSLNLLAGRIRASLSPEHQQAGSAFTVETPNARIDATFSQPDIEVSYNPEKAETIGIAHTVKLMAKNLATNKEVLVPVGSTVIITSEATKVLTGIITTSDAMKPEPTPEPEPVPELIAAPEAALTPEPVSKAAEATTGIGTGKIIALGAGALAAVGGIIAIAGGSSSGSDGGNGGSEDGSTEGIPAECIRLNNSIQGVWYNPEGWSSFSCPARIAFRSTGPAWGTVEWDDSTRAYGLGEDCSSIMITDGAGNLIATYSVEVSSTELRLGGWGTSCLYSRTPPQ